MSRTTSSLATALLLLLAPVVLAQPLAVGPEIAAADAPLLPAFGMQSAPSMATDGSGFFVAWYDANHGGSVRGTRVNDRGELLDEAGILLSQTPAASAPQVLWTG